MSQNSGSRTNEVVLDSYKEERSADVRVAEEIDQGAQAYRITAEQEAFLRSLVDIVRSVPTVVPVPAPVSIGDLIVEIREMGAKNFLGTISVEPNTAEYWIENTERMMDALGYSAADKYRCIVALLQDEAFHWWMSIAKSVPADRLTWDFFRKEFRNKFVGKQYLNAMRKEFINLRQGSLSVPEYEAEFCRLMRYAPEMVSTMELKCERFLDGLRNDLHTALVPLRIDDLRDMSDRAYAVEQSKKRAREENTESKWQGKRPKSVSGFRPQGSASLGGQQPCKHCLRHHGGECWRKTGACIRCGSKDHFIKNCPIASRSAPVATQRSASVHSEGRGYDRGFCAEEESD